MLTNQSDINSFPIYKLFFDDIEEIFLNTISFRILNIITLITCFFLIGILILLCYRSTNLLVTCLIPFIYALVFYDFIQLISLILLKYNFTERFFNQLCRWPYYLKSSSEAGQYLTLIFLFALSRHQIRYFLAHNHLPNSDRIHSRALAFVCLFFIVYVNNWITHLKVERIHLITLNETKYEINIQESPISLYDIFERKTNSHQRFITDLDKYSQGYEKNVNVNDQHTSPTKDQIILNSGDNSIIIKFPYDIFHNSITNRTKRRSKKSKRQQLVHRTIDENKINNNNLNNSYLINRCTYGQTNFFLSNFLSLINSIFYFLVISYYLITISSYKIPYTTLDYHRQSYEKSIAIGRRKSAERHQQLLLLIHLKQFLYLIIYSHTLFTFIRLIYICLLTLILCLVQTPFKWLSMKIFLNSLFLIGYYSIPLRMGLLFIYLFMNHFSTYIQSVFFYLFHTNLRFSWKLEKPTVCCRLQFLPYTADSAQDEHSTNSLCVDISSTIEENKSTVIPHDSIIVYDEYSGGQHCITTSILAASSSITNESIPSAFVVAKL